VLLCFTCDPYQDENLVTREAIQVLHENGYPVHILTKGGTKAIRDFDLLGPQDAFAASLTFLDERDSRKWEPFAAPPEERIVALKEAHKRGIPTWVSLEPVIDPEQTLAIVEVTHPFVDLYKVGKMNHYPMFVDWKRFGRHIEGLLRELGKEYYLKEDLRREMAS